MTSTAGPSRYLLLLTIVVVNSTDYGNDLFGIDLKHNTFIKNGKPYRYIAGDIHYFRIHPMLWADRLQRVRHLGFNAVQVYVPWNFHADIPDVIDFTSSERDLDCFLLLAKEYELDVLLRIGPYICAEWENGGLPWWLLKSPGIGLRQSDPRFLEAVRAYFAVLLPIVKNHLYVSEHRGPVILIQIENEYGSLDVCDRDYMKWLRDEVKVGLDNAPVTLYTTDGSTDKNIQCGVIDGVYPTVDFGPGSAIVPFEVQRRYTKGGPSVNSEYYVTWFSSWGDGGLPEPDTDAVLRTANAMWQMNASFTVYMIHGGTNFGFWAGSHKNKPVLTSYDYVALISEAGDITPAYVELHKWIDGLNDWPQTPLSIPQNFSSVSIDGFEAMQLDLWPFIEQFLTNAPECQVSENPTTFETFSQPHPFVVYLTNVTAGTEHILEAPTVNNIGYVYLDGDFVGIVSSMCDYDDHKEWCQPTVTLSAHSDDSRSHNRTLAILVENTGRINYETVCDEKGLGKVVKLDGKELTGWTQCSINFALVTEKKIREIKRKTPAKRTIFSGPSIYTGTFSAKANVDWRKLSTYFDARQFIKGFVQVNNFNLGRYWTALGPQYTLYTPGPIIRADRPNTVLVVDLVGHDGYCRKIRNQSADESSHHYRKSNRWKSRKTKPYVHPKLRFVDRPIFGGHPPPVIVC